MNRSDIDYIIEKLESYKPDNIYNGYNSEKEKQDQRVAEMLDSIIEEIKSDFITHWTPLSEPPEELPSPCEVVKDWKYRTSEDNMQELKKALRKAVMSVEENTNDTKRSN